MLISHGADALFGFYGDFGAYPVEDLQRYAEGVTRSPENLLGDAPASEGHYYATGDLEVAVAGAPQCRFAAAVDLSRGPAAAIATAYERQGPTFLEGLHGSFALAVIDKRARSVLLAVDRMGIERLAYATVNGGVAFGSAVQAVAHFPPIGARIRLQGLYDYLLLHMVPSPDSVYQNVCKLRPGTFALVTSNQVKVGYYWQPAFTESGPVDKAALAREIREGVATGVMACHPGDRSGAFLSGGLDSSSVAGMMCRTLNRAVPTFSIGFGVDAYNELEYARIASRHFGSTPHEYEVTADDIVEVFDSIAAAYDEPFGNSSAVPTLFCARLAKRHGIDHLLAGDGGDEIFGGNERYARQGVFEIYRRLPHWFQSTSYALSRWIDEESPITPLRKFRSYVDQASIPMPERLETWNFMYRTDLSAMLAPDFRSSIDPRAPFRRMAEVYDSSQCSSLVNKMLFYDWHYTLADNDLRKVSTMCKLAGIKVSYPMLHPDLIDVSLRIPPELKVKGKQLRVFYKEAMADFLPVEIIKKAKHGFGLPFGQWLKTHSRLGDLVYSNLEDLKRRRLIRADFLDRVVAEHKSGHPSYFGYAIWDLAMLEAWLKAHRVAL